MSDFSHLDKKYFIDEYVYNCPFCNRNNVRYEINSNFSFDWNENKKCYGIIIECSSCANTSMHLSYIDLLNTHCSRFRDEFAKDIDSHIFYSVPTSFFVLDNRIPSTIRNLISEGEGSLKMNFLTGASACARKAIYELMVHEKCSKKKYDERIKEIQDKHNEVDKLLFSVLKNIKDMTSDKVHEQSWDKWDTKNLRVIFETLKTILVEMYVVPCIKQDRVTSIKSLLNSVTSKNNSQK